MPVRSTESQCAKILEFMESGCAITPRRAMRLFGCYRLAARIKDLREDGYDIRTNMITRLNRYKKAVRIAEYILGGDE